MPLRVWRTDETTPLGPHPNDPGGSPGPKGTAQEFLTTFVITPPPGTPEETVAATKAREAERAHELATEGHLARLWLLPGPERSLGLWRAADAAEMQTILRSLPLDKWMTVETVALTEHPSDPAITGA